MLENQPKQHLEPSVSDSETLPFWWKGLPLNGHTDTLSLRAKVDPSMIGILNSLVDAHDGIACLRTLDSKSGEIEFWISPDCLDDFRQVLAGIQEVADVRIERDERIDL